jgi:hypothetical protein
MLPPHEYLKAVNFNSFHCSTGDIKSEAVPCRRLCLYSQCYLVYSERIRVARVTIFLIPEEEHQVCSNLFRMWLVLGTESLSSVTS